MNKNLIVLILALLGFNINAQEFNRAKMDSLFAVIEAHDKAMGSFSIFKNGKEVYQKSIGFSDVEKGTLANAETKYRIGSISKTFTATMIMQMIEEGKLSLGTKLSAFYPEIPNASKITIEQLLGHRSGLFNFTDPAAFYEYSQELKTKTELLKIFKENGTSFIPGEKSEYSNTNYVLLSFIAEDIDKKPFAEILNNRIITPLDLKNTGYGGKINTAANEAQSYAKATNWRFITETDMSIPIGSGSIVSTPTDINKFFHALFNGKLVKKASVEKMKTLKDGYGFGLFRFPFYEKKLFGNTGEIDQFISMVGYIVEEDFSFAFSTNGLDMEMNDIAVGMQSIYFGREFNLPKFTAPFKISEENLLVYPGVYSSRSFPLEVVISREDNAIIAQATGQPSFILEPIEEHKFKFDWAELKIDFIPAENKMLLYQDGDVHEFVKK